MAIGSFLGNDAETDELNDATRSELGGTFIGLSEGSVHYELAGPKGAQTVVLIHGNAAPCFTWDHNVPALLEAGFDVLSYDIYGHGYSDRPELKEYNRSLYHEQLLQLLDSLGLQEPIDIVGTSQGGAIATHFTASHPERVRKLALLAPLYDTFAGARSSKIVALPRIGEYVFRAFGDKVNLQNLDKVFASGENVPEFAEKYKRAMRFKGLKRAKLANLRGDSLENNEHFYKEVEQQERPVLLIWGTSDKLISESSIKRLRRAMPSVQYHEIRGAGHIVHYERPEDVNPMLVGFLK
jgi:pimeloyl-ACP methyl ester carboxylesterase